MAKTKKKAGTAKTRRESSMGKPKEQLAVVAFVPPATIKLEFADSFHAQLDIHRLGIPVDIIEWHTLKVSPTGEKVTVSGIKGDAVPIDSATLRYLVDEAYAAKIDKSLEKVRMSREELAAMARENPPPQEWLDEPETDLTRESWQ